MEPVEFREMELIIAVSRELSFTRAAEKCYISQPALSKIVRRVEKNLGAAIFDRSSSPLRVTSEGEHILAAFGRMMKMQDDLERFCTDLRRRNNRGLKVGAPSFFCTYVLPQAVSAWQLEHPGCAVRLIESNDAELRELLRAGILDIGLTVEGEVPQGTETRVLGTERVLLAVPRECSVNERLARFALSENDLRRGNAAESTARVPMSEFAHENFLFLKEGNDTRARGLKICREAGFEPNIVMELDQMLTAYRLAESGLGITFVRDSLPCRAGFSPDLCFYRVDHPDTEREIRAIFSPIGSGASRREEFIDFLRSFQSGM